MTDHASYIFSVYSSILQLPKEQILEVGNFATEGNPIPSFDEDLLIDLCEDATQLFEKEENVLEIEGDSIVVGDIHGSFHDLLRILLYTENSDSKVIFLGDYVDRGNFSLECITLLFSLKIMKPEKYFLLRGNHEFIEMSSNYGFKKEILNYHNPKKIEKNSRGQIELEEKNEAIIKKIKNQKKDQKTLQEEFYYSSYININCYKYTERLFDAFMKSFSYMPICAIINQDSICLHGGLSPLLEKVRNIQKQIQRPITDFNQNLLLTDILWGDPAPEQNQTYFDNPRGRGKLFNGPVVVNFLKNNNFKRLIRGHECVHSGIEKLFNGKCVTIFSASSYSCDMGNSSAILKLFQSNDKTETLIFSPLHRLKKCDASYYKVQCFNEQINYSDKKISDYNCGFLPRRKNIRCTNSEHILPHDLYKSDDFDNSKPLIAKNKISLNRRFPCLKPGSRRRIVGPMILTPQINNQKCQSCD